MQAIQIYTTATCSYCVRAKRLLAAKGASWEEIDVGSAPERREEMVGRAGGRTTVPQIFIGTTHVGGYDDLAELERQGELDTLLAE